MPFFRTVLKAGFIKFLLTLVSTRNVTKTIESFKYEIPRFGAAFGVAGALVQIVIWFLRRYAKKMGNKWPFKLSDKHAYFLAALLCSLPITFGLNAAELNLAKLLFFPLAWRCLSDKVLQKGLVPNVRHGDIIVYMLVCFFCSYTFMMEKSSCPPALHKMVKSYCLEDRFEGRSYNVSKMAIRAEIRNCYFKAKY